LQLAATGLSLAGDVVINAANIHQIGAGPVRLAARSADVRLSGAEAFSLDARVQQLGLSLEAAGPLAISNDGNLHLTHLNAPQADALSFAINGSLRLPSTGLTAARSLVINATDLFDEDRQLSLSAPQLQVALTAASGQNLWDLAVDELDLSLAGTANINLTDSQGLTFADLNGDGQSLSLADGNLGLLLSTGDLTIKADMSAADANNDANSAGVIDLAVAQGSISTEGPVRITSTQQPAGAEGSFAIRMRLTDTSAANRSIRLNHGTEVLAIGGDILMDTRPGNTQAGAQRQYIQAQASGGSQASDGLNKTATGPNKTATGVNQTAGARVTAYTNNSDPRTGRVTLNAIPVLASTGQSIGAGRWLAIIADAPPDTTGALAGTEDLSQLVKPVEVLQPAGMQVSEQFGKVFGDCDELDPKNRNRCKVDSALKAFLSHWLVGGELPSKMEQK
jgi:hypothetical protein